MAEMLRNVYVSTSMCAWRRWRCLRHLYEFS